MSSAIESVLAQTYNNWELIIIANGCNDDTATVVNRYVTDERITFCNFPESLGGAQSRNIGMSKARGEYLAFLDDDDRWLPNKLEIQIDFITKHKFAIVSCNYVSVSDTKRKIEKHEGIYSLNDLYYSNYIGSLSFGLTKTEYVKGLTIDPSLKVAQDWYLWIEILKKTGMKSVVLADVLAVYSNKDSRTRLSSNFKDALHAKVQFARYLWPNLNWAQKSHYLEMLRRAKWRLLPEKRSLLRKINFHLNFNSIFSSKNKSGWFIYYLKHPSFIRFIRLSRTWFH